MAFKIGAGSIRAYPHAENTGLVISDDAKIGRNLESSKYLSCFLHFSETAKLFFGKVVGGYIDYNLDNSDNLGQHFYQSLVSRDTHHRLLSPSIFIYLLLSTRQAELAKVVSVVLVVV